MVLILLLREEIIPLDINFLVHVLEKNISCVNHNMIPTCRIKCTFTSICRLLNLCVAFDCRQSYSISYDASQNYPDNHLIYTVNSIRLAARRNINNSNRTPNAVTLSSLESETSKGCCKIRHNSVLIRKSTIN